MKANDHRSYKILVVASDRYIPVADARSGSTGYEQSNDKNLALCEAGNECVKHWGNPVKFLTIDNVKSRVDWGIIN